MAYLLERGGYKSLAQLHESLNLVGSVQLWSAYKAGKASPQEATVKLADKVIPGSASLFLNGPDGLPLWAVLDGDIEACQRVVSSVLDAFVEPEKWMSVARRSIGSMGDSDKLKALLEIVLPQSLWQPATPDSMRYNPSAPHNIELVGWLSLVELFERAENPLATQYIKDKIKSGQENIIKSFVLGIVAKVSGGSAFAEKPKYNLTNPSYILAFIACIQIANESRDKALMKAPEFLKMGVGKAVVDTFGADVAYFVDNL